tara:strand:+ start:52 stop:234 length:183 start_codon:yes stop_codon:yes gene_type:complete
MNTPPPTQKVSVIVSSIPPQLEATSVQYHGVKIWNKIDPKMTKKNIIPACIWHLYRRIIA